ncbi:4-demethylwyosine synthase TYW1 [Candidatus Bathyarchaeota archaeon A05DMB-2]|jgi:tRNA wybutosine-synthesizing protein 1|nr:4-demethylwyosine synthase TYW1 [Candidatus Bathyarchaeota archaeon A05DMB-2]
MENPISPALLQALKKQKYHLVGKHSAVKKCKWLHEALVHGRPCYKQKFYGIKSHQCVQMTPALFYCTQQCLFCWRAQSGDLQVTWNEMQPPDWDSVEEIVSGSLRAQDKILSGYMGNSKVDWRKLTEALRPRHVAISLTGEPTLYENLGELIRTFHHEGFTTFLVSNGTMPSKLAELSEEPTQLYISVCAPNEQVFRRVCRPQLPSAWAKLRETLGSLPSFRCPTVIRMTLVRGHNMEPVEGYAELVEKASPTYIEAKAYMHVGFSTLRLRFEDMPEHGEVYAFAERLAELTGYGIIDEAVESRVVLLSTRKKPIRFESS